MKLVVATVLGVLVASSSFAQSTPEIEKALMAAPANLREGATVIKWKPDFSYDTVKQGTNRLVCHDRSGLPQQQAFSVECTSIGNIERAAQNLKFAAAGGTDRAKTQALLDAAEKDGTRAKPEFGSVWYHVQGPDKDHLRNHMTIAVPMATSKTLGLPEDNKQGGVWIMNAGTSTAHLMVPGE
jgi:hypothetical protein